MPDCMENDNLALLEAVVENTEMGKNTLDQMIPMAEEGLFKAELLREKNEYHKINQEAHTCMAACGSEARGQTAFAKINTKMGIGMKTMTDKSTGNLAQMIAEGSGQGVMDCIRQKKDHPNATPGAKRLCQRLEDFEKETMKKMEEFL